MQQHFPRTVVAFDFAVYADGAVALEAEEFQLDAGVDNAVADDLGFVGQLGALVLVDEAVVVVRLVAADTEVGVFGLAVLASDVVLAELAGDFLDRRGRTSLSSRYLDSLMVKWTM